MVSKNDPELDIIFLSYRESNADENWQALQARFPRAKRVHGVRGIDKAHQRAAQISDSRFFFVIDGDNEILPTFQFRKPVELLQDDTLYVWRCLNPVNNLAYGFGAVKLYNKKLMERRLTRRFLDHATQIAERYHVVHELASRTHFFNTPFEAWRGAFRECAKLTSQQIRGQKSKESEERLHQWLTRFNDVPNTEWVQRGAIAGHNFALENPNQMSRINNFNWLEKRFYLSQSSYAKAHYSLWKRLSLQLSPR